ncbi:MAG: recombinase family protein [Acidobacteriota bacterium]
MNKMAEDRRAVAYIRVSTKPQDQYSPEVQKDKCRAYADRLEVNLKIVKPFEEARSGWKANARVEFYKMLEFIEQEKIPNLIYAYPDRLSRNTEDYVKLKATNVKLHNANTGISFSPNNPDDFEQIAAFEYDQVDSKKRSHQISKGVRDGYAKIVEKGKFPHAVPLGYDPDWKYVNGKLVKRIVIDPVRGPLIQQMFRLFATGTYTRKTIAAKIRDLGLRSRKGNIIAVSQIEKYLKDVKYTGQQFRWKGGEAQEWHDDCPPLISTALFNEVQAVFEAKSRPRCRGGHDYPLKGLITCGLCGSPYIEEDHERHYFRCTYQRQACNKLGSPRLKGSELDLLLETAIGMIDFEQSVYEWLKGEVEETYRLNRETEAVEKKRLTAEKDSIEEERSRALQAFTKGITTDEGLVREEINRLTDRKARIEARLKELDAGEDMIIQNSLDTLGILKDFKNQYLSADPEKRRRMHVLLFRKVAVHPLKQSRKELLADPKRALLLGEYPLDIEWNEPFDWLFEGKSIRELGRLADEAVTEDMMLGWMKKSEEKGMWRA